ncbi:LON peptidase substrate-binding domain-containing protein [Marisediminitalea sp.]|uniref:LON peptidase substrate-binding domain-containing protein n=1 Tax=Marisediminitalea sp. TaxID=2662268 RepID=UPI000C8E8322|nr:peptidase S16 [Alteromonadaceae bacterium]HBY38603.1 peptidase S16 [Alteromonas sp.]|tara:strand:- start:14543 stop:15118 length:576 start_codon:yes stop_codon:yes gene_type:complete
MHHHNIPLFPLSAHLLPGGHMALRIFEPRYVRMVKEACAGNGYFVLCMLNSRGDQASNEHIFPIGTLCKIVDFDLLDDGLLGINVEGVCCVSVENIKTEADGLRIGDCTEQHHWSCVIEDEKISPLRIKLELIYDKYPEIARLYPELKFNDPMWVIYRWLELLPVDAANKQAFLGEKNCDNVLNYISELVR